MAKKQEDTWTIHHNPPFEVVDITVINDPSNSAWTVYLGNTVADLHITDLAGRVLWSHRSVSGQVVIDAQQFVRGTYVLQLNAEGRTGHGMLVRE